MFCLKTAAIGGGASLQQAAAAAVYLRVGWAAGWARWGGWSGRRRSGGSSGGDTVVQFPAESASAGAANILNLSTSLGGSEVECLAVLRVGRGLGGEATKAGTSESNTGGSGGRLRVGSNTGSTDAERLQGPVSLSGSSLGVANL